MLDIGSLIQTLAEGGPVMTPLVVCSVVALAVVIEADTDVRHGRVVDVTDAARLAGVGRLAIAVTPRETRL